jgi:hypothetical protein
MRFMRTEGRGREGGAVLRLEVGDRVGSAKGIASNSDVDIIRNGCR